MGLLIFSENEEHVLGKKRNFVRKYEVFYYIFTISSNIDLRMTTYTQGSLRDIIFSVSARSLNLVGHCRKYLYKNFHRLNMPYFGDIEKQLTNAE